MESSVLAMLRHATLMNCNMLLKATFPHLQALSRELHASRGVVLNRRCSVAPDRLLLAITVIAPAADTARAMPLRALRPGVCDRDAPMRKRGSGASRYGCSAAHGRCACQAST
jgi:hypothetical protein